MAFTDSPCILPAAPEDPTCSLPPPTPHVATLNSSQSHHRHTFTPRINSPHSKMAWPRSPFPPEHRQRATLLGLLISLLIVSTARSVLLHERHFRHISPSAGSGFGFFLGSDPSAFSSARRARLIIARLAAHPRSGRGRARVVHGFVSMVGILGMFAAVTGALFGPWIADDEDDDDGFRFWASCEEGEKDTAEEREERYTMLRMVEVP